MSNRREDDSRPSASAISQRATLRDVPAAKHKDASVGTVAPRGLRGPSLLPGQGAPERIIPEQVELAVLRDADTLDGPKVARAAAGRRASSESRSPSPTPVSVEVPRARSMPPARGEYASTPEAPSARSIQSGTLMSIGSVDPRAPTELSLPSPRPMSVSERAAYLGPEAVVDRTPPSLRRAPPSVGDKSREGNVSEPPVPVSAPPVPQANSPRSVPASASVRPSLKADSVAPPAQNFARVPRSYSPVSLSPTPTPMKPPRPTPTPMRPPRPTPKPPRPEAAPSVPPPASSGLGVPPQFQIHSELDAVPHELQEDAFDLRSASTQREPLASRKAQPSADWTPHAPASVASGEGDLRAPSNRSSSPAVTILVDRVRESAPPASEHTPPQRAAVPLSWVLGAAAFAVILALIVAFALRPSAPPQAVPPLDGRASAAAPRSVEPAPREAAPPAVAPGAKRSGAASAARPTGTAPKSAARAASSPAASGSAAASASADPNSKVHQSIY
ncbi:MAG: hypothetical protein WDO69_01900 [Pseudomonadota bacterium]